MLIQKLSTEVRRFQGSEWYNVMEGELLLYDNYLNYRVRIVGISTKQKHKLFIGNESL